MTTASPGTWADQVRKVSKFPVYNRRENAESLRNNNRIIEHRPRTNIRSTLSQLVQILVLHSQLSTRQIYAVVLKTVQSIKEIPYASSPEVGKKAFHISV